MRQCIKHLGNFLYPSFIIINNQKWAIFGGFIPIPTIKIITFNSTLPSCKLTVRYGKSPSLIGKSTIKGYQFAIFNSKLPLGKLTFCYGKSPLLMAKSTINIYKWAIFNSFLYVYQRLQALLFRGSRGAQTITEWTSARSQVSCAARPPSEKPRTPSKGPKCATASSKTCRWSRWSHEGGHMF